jgi:hypothetical protein
MAEGISISLEHNLKKVDASLAKLRKQQIVKATRQAVNKTVTSVRTFTARKLRTQRNLKVGEIKKAFMKLFKAKGNTIDKLNAKIEISGRSVSLIRYVTGKKEPRAQKGIAVKKRKDLKAKIKPGKSVKIKSAFIAKGTGGKYHVFRRMDNKRRKRPDQKGPIAKQSTSALSIIFERNNVRRPVETFAGRRLLIEFNRSVNLQLMKMKGKFK